MVLLFQGVRRPRDAKVLKMPLLNSRDCAWYLECFREVLIEGKTRRKWVREMNATRPLRTKMILFAFSGSVRWKKVGRCTPWNFSVRSFNVCKFNVSLFHFSHDKILENKTVDDRWYYVVCREISFSKLYTRSYIATYHERISLKIMKNREIDLTRDTGILFARFFKYLGCKVQQSYVSFLVPCCN